MPLKWFMMMNFTILLLIIVISFIFFFYLPHAKSYNKYMKTTNLINKTMWIWKW
uniref:ATP synthase F0 subunit 8 n=1 Tax=Aphaenogaster japonica TaxID=602661 RepID=UPI001EDDFBAA|nr:ATP synthase F0 subunit 8 [Aphaenogaster japonica]UHY39315.1 ATP synthase F0 subunit 8 [Aphaenogaster japonica]